MMKRPTPGVWRRKVLSFSRGREEKESFYLRISILTPPRVLEPGGFSSFLSNKGGEGRGGVDSVY